MLDSKATSEDQYLFYDDSDFQTHRLLISMALLLFITISFMNEYVTVVVADSRSSIIRPAWRLKSPRFFIASYLVIVLKLLGQVSKWHIN